MAVKVDGSCHCGFVTFTAEADPDKTQLCHCTDCQALTGTAFRTVVRVGESFRLLTGEPTEYVKIAENGKKRIQAFCPKCGSSLYSAAAGDGPRNYGLRTGTLRQRAQFVPRREIWCRSAQSWAAAIPGTEKIETQ